MKISSENFRAREGHGATLKKWLTMAAPGYQFKEQSQALLREHIAQPDSQQQRLYASNLEAAQVGLYANGINGTASQRVEIQRMAATTGCIYRAGVPASPSPADDAARVIPHCGDIATPLEDARILWQRGSDRRKPR